VKYLGIGLAVLALGGLGYLGYRAVSSKSADEERRALDERQRALAAEQAQLAQQRAAVGQGTPQGGVQGTSVGGDIKSALEGASTLLMAIQSFTASGEEG